MNIIQIDRNSGKTPSQILAKAMDHHAAGELLDAEADYLAVIAQGYRAADVLPLLAGIAAANGDIKIALDRWTELLDLQPTHLFGLMEKGAPPPSSWQMAGSRYMSAGRRADRSNQSHSSPQSGRRIGRRRARPRSCYRAPAFDGTATGKSACRASDTARLIGPRAVLAYPDAERSTAQRRF